MRLCVQQDGIPIDYFVTDITENTEGTVEAVSYGGVTLGPFGSRQVVVVEFGADDGALGAAYEDLECRECDAEATWVCECGAPVCDDHECTVDCGLTTAPVDTQRTRGVIPGRERAESSMEAHVES